MVGSWLAAATPLLTKTGGQIWRHRRDVIEAPDALAQQFRRPEVTTVAANNVDTSLTDNNADSKKVRQKIKLKPKTNRGKKLLWLKILKQAYLQTLFGSTRLTHSKKVVIIGWFFIIWSFF